MKLHNKTHLQKDSSKKGTKEEKESFHNKTRVQNKRISFKQKGKKETSQKKLT